MARNSFNGVLDPCFGEINTLIAFSVKSNDLEGPIPDSFSKLTNVYHLSFDDAKQEKNVHIFLKLIFVGQDE
jgi:hypothetical protein